MRSSVQRSMEAADCSKGVEADRRSGFWSGSLAGDIRSQSEERVPNWSSGKVSIQRQ